MAKDWARPVVHWEIRAVDPERLRAFYGEMFNWKGRDVELFDTRTLTELRRDAARWGRFNFLTNWGEQFDGYKSFLLCPPGEPVRVLSRRLPSHMGRGVSVSRQGVASAAAGFAAWFESESGRLGVPCQRHAEPGAAADGGGM